MPRLGDIPQIKSKLDRIRSTIAYHDAVQLDEKLAYSIIEALRVGAAPTRGAILLAIGREAILETVRRDLALVSGGDSALMVLNGDWGMGKTLTLRLLQDYAFQQSFATSFVTLTPRECPLYDLRAVYRHIVKNIRVGECRDSPALEWILSSWAERVRNDVRLHGMAPWSLWHLSDPFKEVLTIYFGAVSSGKFMLAAKAMAWMYGDIATLRDAKELGLSSVVTQANALEMLGNLTVMVRELGVQGLVILLDEAETVPSVCGTARGTEACVNLGRLANSAGSTPHSYFVYATTPKFFSYLQDSGLDESVIANQPIVNLENLDKAELLDLVLAIRDIYLHAFGWGGDLRTKDRELGALLSSWLVELKDDATPRVIVRRTVQVLDLLHDNPGLLPRGIRFTPSDERAGDSPRP